MSFEHCHSCLPPVRYPGCQDHCPHYAADIAKHRAVRHVAFHGITRSRKIAEEPYRKALVC